MKPNVTAQNHDVKCCCYFDEESARKRWSKFKPPNLTVVFGHKFEGGLEIKLISQSIKLICNGLQRDTIALFTNSCSSSSNAHYKQTSRSESNLNCWITYSSSECFWGFIFTWRIDRYAISGRNTWWCATIYGVKKKRSFLLIVRIYRRFRRKARWCCSKFKAWVTLRKR